MGKDQELWLATTPRMGTVLCVMDPGHIELVPAGDVGDLTANGSANIMRSVA